MRSLWILASALGKTCFHTGYREVHVSLIIITDSGAGVVEDLLSFSAGNQANSACFELLRLFAPFDKHAQERVKLYEDKLEEVHGEICEDDLLEGRRKCEKGCICANSSTKQYGSFTAIHSEFRVSTFPKAKSITAAIPSRVQLIKCVTNVSFLRSIMRDRSEIGKRRTQDNVCPLFRFRPWHSQR